jgi:pimeloyl-ACP methyl ester carboxylesterase
MERVTGRPNQRRAPVPGLADTGAGDLLRRIVLLPDCGHWTQQERPADVNDELLAFLRHEQHP